MRGRTWHEASRHAGEMDACAAVSAGMMDVAPAATERHTRATAERSQSAKRHKAAAKVRRARCLPCMPFLLDCCAKRENNPPCEANRRVRSPGRVTWEAGSQSAFTEPPRLLGAIDMRSNKARLKTTLAIMPGIARTKLRRKKIHEIFIASVL